MKAICIIDTTIFCELLAVPNMHANAELTTLELEEKLANRERLLLPLTTVIETGNHIGQNGDGTLRRRAAQLFVDQVKQALTGEAPFVLTRLFEYAQLVACLDRFPDWATMKRGLGDLTIVREYELLCELHRGRRVYIWSNDEDLQGYDSAS
ncbi:MAG: hypothetical protein H6745_30425 [Deltaproteobacteria bacterium]|nr:hypothetical protein [Deltaproteobacteria bacterium]